MGWPGLTREVQEICKTVGLPDVTKKYLCMKEITEHIQYYDMKMAKEEMADKEKCQVIRNRDCCYVQPYMYEKSVLQSRMEFPYGEKFENSSECCF